LFHAASSEEKPPQTQLAMENRHAHARPPDAPTSRLCCRRSRGVIQLFAHSDSHVFTPKSNWRLTNDQNQNA
jgi:hypothetical protein